MRERPPLNRTREGYTLEWLQNETKDKLHYWASRNELEAHAYRKSYLARLYDTSMVILGEPQATEQHSVEDLIGLGILGLYGWRRNA